MTGGQAPGPGVDAQGFPVVDPTANVLALVHAANERQDDLRKAESRHVRELLDRDAKHAAEIREKEAARLDAIRLVDVNAVQRAAETQATIAETLRTQVASTATASAAALAAALDPIVKSVAELQRVQFELAGARESTREGAGDRRASTGTVVAVVGVSLTLLFSLVGVALTLLARSS